MHESEGVIQFTLDHTNGPALEHPAIALLTHFHNILYQRGLVGRDSQRYGGYAFGNISARLSEDSFIISGTQTGDIEKLDASHFSLIESCDIYNNKVKSYGPVKPSSECMTHAAIYAATQHAGAVVHVHSTQIWNNVKTLGLLSTGADVSYGTPAMASTVSNCIHQMGEVNHGSIVMLGHEDGVIAWGENIEQATTLILDSLAKLGH